MAADVMHHMKYDLEMIQQLCSEIGLVTHRDDNDTIKIELAPAVVLYFQNAERNDDCLVGFLGTPWHAHDDFMFCDGHGNHTEMNYLDILTGLKEGKILICELRKDGKVVDRWITHSEYNDEFKYMELGEEIVVRRAGSIEEGKGQSA